MNNTVVRFAPTVSGRLHLGSLWNCLLNWLYARKNSGVYNVRLDGHLIKGTRCVDRDNILSDLQLFGLEADNLIRQEDRLQEHIDAFKQLVQENPDRFYECDCTINDIAARNLFPSGKPMYRLIRNEKYPRPCRLQKIEIFDLDNNNIALNQNISVSHEARENPASILTTDNGDYAHFWSNTDIGNMSSPEMTSLEIKFETVQTIYGLQLTYRDMPFLDYQVFVWHNDSWKAVAKVNKPVEYFVEPRPALQYPAGLQERVNFAPIPTTAVKIDITRLPLPLDRPYHYDYHCKFLNKKLNWTDGKTVVRCHYNDSVLMNYLEFVTEERIPRSNMAIDTAVWFDRKPDLVFSSPYDDHSMGATHIIRGRDIYHFMLMEIQLTCLMKYKPVYHYHSMILDKKGVKYSKFVKSKAISSYLSGKVTPGTIMGYLAWKGGIVNNYPGDVKPQDLLPYFDLAKISKNDICIDDDEMVAYISAS